MSDIKVLIVDDQEIYRSALSDLLAVVDGYHVVALAASGEESLELARKADLVFMDVRLSGIDGPAATRLIRASDDPPEVVMISTDVESLRSTVVQDCGALTARAKSDLDPEWLDALREQIAGAATRPR